MLSASRRRPHRRRGSFGMHGCVEHHPIRHIEDQAGVTTGNRKGPLDPAEQ